MDTDKKRYIYHLDNLRIKKKMTIATLCQDICSTRQYRKYMSGVNNISDARIAEFCTVLGVSTRDFYYSLNTADIYEFNSLKEIFELIKVKKYIEATEKIEKLSNPEKLSVQNKKFFDYCSMRLKYERKIVYPSETIQVASEIINYPKCAENDAFDFIDIIVLQIIAQIEIQAEKTSALNLLINILSNSDLLYMSTETRVIIPTIYSTVSTLLGRLKRYHECMKVAEAGIEYCNKYHYSKSLTWLYYAMSLSNKHLNRVSEAELYAVYCMTNVIASRNHNHIQHYYNLLSKDFNKDPFMMINDHKLIILEEK